MLLLSCRMDPCPAGQVWDCSRTCQPEILLADGVCHDGTPDEQGDPTADLACSGFGFDGGDCEAPVRCFSHEIEGCGGGCIEAGRLGDGRCDQALSCLDFLYDGGDCLLPDTGPRDCGEGRLADCIGQCAPDARLGNGFCDDGSAQPWGAWDLACEELEWDGGDCVPPDTGPCADGEILDCDGSCWPEARLDNDFCDDGTLHPWGAANFACADLSWDGGDCRPPDTGPCPQGEMLDCLGECWPAARRGNGFCDDGTVHPWGAADFACESLNWDDGDCGPPDTSACPSGQQLDCQGFCWPSTRVGNGFCDDGTVHAWGSSDFACAAFAWDGGDCPTPDTGLALPDTGP